MENAPQKTADEWLEKALAYEREGKTREAEMCLKKAIAVEQGL